MLELLLRTVLKVALMYNETSLMYNETSTLPQMSHMQTLYLKHLISVRSLVCINVIIVLNKFNSVMSSNLDFSIRKSNLETTHGMQYCRHALYCITVNNWNEAKTLRL